MLHPAELELGETARAVMAKIDGTRPARVVFDSLSEMRLLAQNPLRYRRQVLALKRFFTQRECTVLLLDDRTSESPDLQLHSIAHGVLLLEQLPLDYGAERRRLRAMKVRGTSFRGGWHDYTIRRGGLVIFPRLEPSEHRTTLSDGSGQQRIGRARRAARRRAGARDQRAADGAGRGGQDLDGHLGRHGGAAARREGRLFRVRRGAADAC